MSRYIIDTDKHMSPFDGIIMTTVSGLEDADKALDDADQRGLENAWEAARKIADMWTRIDNEELLAIFGITERIGHSTIRSLFEKQTANEAMLVLEAYEEKQKAENEIKVGDEVTDIQSGANFLVTHLWESNQGDKGVSGFNRECSAFQSTIDKVKKTGRHFDIDKILEEMKE